VAVGREGAQNWLRKVDVVDELNGEDEPAEEGYIILWLRSKSNNGAEDADVDGKGGRLISIQPYILKEQKLGYV
jgi:hypothetical protein